MTLSEPYEMAYSTDASRPVTMYVFEDDESRDKYRNNPREGGILLVLQSHYKASVFLKEQYASAIVRNFYAIDRDQVDVVIGFREEENGNDIN